MKRVASLTATDIDGDTNSSARLMDKPKRSKPAVTFDPQKILKKVKAKMQLSARLKEAANSFLQVAIEVMQSPYSTAILEDMDLNCRNLTLMGYFGLTGLQALQAAIKSVPTSYCNIRCDYIQNIVSLFSNNPVTCDIVKRAILVIEDDCDFKKVYEETVRHYSTKV